MDKDDVRFHRGKGVPLEGPFLGLFHRGFLGEMNENVHFSDFRIFWYFDLLRLRISTPPHQVMKDPQSLLQLRKKPFNVRSNLELEIQKTLDGLECPEGYQATFYS